MITSATGSASAPVTATIDRSQLRLFAKATGQTDPTWTDVTAAQAAGHTDLPVPPTFLFGIELQQEEPFGWLTQHGVDMSAVLHGTQSFDYVTPVFAGDTVTASSSITDVQVKKGGALTMVERRTDITRDAETVARLTSVIVVRSAA
ncbi:MAG: MaoC-like dehydratase [Frankiales bacterium]|nr:MaoC-like dehydratase [Frankiales bacterium]